MKCKNQICSGIKTWYVMVAWLLLLQLPTSSHIMYQRSITVILQSGIIEYMVAKILVFDYRFFLSYFAIVTTTWQRRTCSAAYMSVKNSLPQSMSYRFGCMCSWVTYFGFLRARWDFSALSWALSALVQSSWHLFISLCFFQQIFLRKGGWSKTVKKF